MPINVIMPALGVAQQTGTLLKWLKAEGESVSKGEPLMEIETDKSTVEIEAAASGVLARVAAKAGDEVPVGETIALILAAGETLPAIQDIAPAKSPQRHLPVGAGSREHGTAGSTRKPATDPAVATSLGHGRILASPKAKRIAKEQGIQLSSVRGSGPEGSMRR